MNLLWNDKSVAVSPATEHKTSSLRRGDFVVYNGELLKVNTAQIGCASLNGPVNSFVLENRAGKEFGTINLPNKATIFKRKGKVVWS